MTEWHTYLRTHWFAIALSSKVSMAPIRAMLFGRPVVVFRSSDGSVTVLEDRCPHRGVPLSGGHVGEAGIVCPYHGWTFNHLGQCVAMPGTLNSMPLAQISVPKLAALERDGLVWVTQDAKNPLPERVKKLDPQHRRFLEPMRWGAPILEAQENFLDALHTHSVHPGLVRGGDVRRAIQVTLTKTHDGFMVEYQGESRQSGLLFRLFESPRVSERAYYSALSTAQIEYRYPKGTTVWISLFFTPETDTSTRVFASLHLEGRWAPKWLVRAIVWPFLRRVAKQDQRMLERQQSNSEHFPQRRAIVTSQDVVRPYLEMAWSPSERVLEEKVTRTLYL